jgi:hypothetical protein
MFYPILATFGFSRQTSIVVDLDSLPGRKQIFSSLQRSQAVSGVHPASGSNGTGVLSHGEYSRGMNFTTYLHPELNNKSSTLLPMYVFMAQRGTFFLYVISVTFLLIG